VKTPLLSQRIITCDQVVSAIALLNYLERVMGENNQSHMYFYEYQVETKVVSGLVNTPICNPNDAKYLLMAIESDVFKKGFDEVQFGNGRLLSIKRV
jgi:hypothetical protein